MEKSDWVKIEKGAIMPDEKTGVQIFVRDKDDSFNVFMAHQEEGVWFVFDPFEKKFRIYARQQYITHYKYLNVDELPKEYSDEKDKVAESQ